MDMEIEYRKLSEIIYPELLRTQKLTSSSYLSNSLMLWKLKLEFVLKDYNVHHVLVTSNPNPEDPSWLDAEELAETLIGMRLDESLCYKLDKSPSVKSFIDYLDSTYNGTGKVSCQSCLCQNYSFLKMDPDGDVNEHMFKMRATAKVVGLYGVEVDEKVQGLMLLDSLPDDWDEEVERVMMELHASKEDLSFDNVGRRLRTANEFRKWGKYRDSDREGWSEGGSERGKKGDKGKTSTSNGDETDSFSDYPPSHTEIIYHDIKTRFQLNHTGKYYKFWKGQIHNVLRANKLGHLLNDNSPSKEDPSSQRKRLSDEFTARHLILGGMSDDLFLSFHDYPTARALMDSLDTWFSSPSIANQMLLFTKYTRCQMSENAQINQHLLDMDVMLAEMKNVSLEVPDVMQAQRMINSLPRSWSDIQMVCRTNLGVKKDDNKKLVDRVRETVKSAGFCREMNVKQREDSEPRYQKPRKGNCYNCGRSSHYYYNCPDDS